MSIDKAGVCLGVETRINNFPHIVIRVEDTGDVLSQVPVQHSLNIATDIDCGTRKKFVNGCEII